MTPSRLRTLALLAIGGLASSPAFASPRAVAVLAGDCNESALLAQGKRLVAQLEQASGVSMRPPEVDGLLGIDPERTIDELQRQLDSAQMLYYQGELPRAQELTQASQVEVGRLAPMNEKWKLAAYSRLLLAQIDRGLNHAAEGDEQLRGVLRLDPDFKLDPDYYSPSTRRHFDQLRAQLKSVSRVDLSIRSSPPGADAYVDGKKVGTTPLTVSLLPGDYTVALARGTARSFPHPISVSASTTLVVDLAFEGWVRVRQPLCVADDGNEVIRLSNAVKLATLLRAEQIVLVRLERPTHGPSWFVASLVDAGTAQKIREGGLRPPTQGDVPEGLEELADFVLTGKHGSKVVMPPGADSSAGPTASPSSTVRSADAPVARALPSPEVTRFEMGAFTAPPLTFNRKVGYGLGAAGFAAAIGAVAVGVAANNSWNQFDTYFLANDSLPQANRPGAIAAQNRATTEQNVALITAGASAVALGAAVYFLFVRHDAP